jgi:hypothetical protein
MLLLNLNDISVAREGYEKVSLSGDHSEWEPPDPIPNSEVKTLRADDSVSFSCESRSLPGFYSKPLLVI